MNLGIPCLAYGIAAEFLISHKEVMKTSKGDITIHFLYKEYTYWSLTLVLVIMMDIAIVQLIQGKLHDYKIKVLN